MNRPRRRSSFFSRSKKKGGSFWGSQKLSPSSIASILNDNDQEPRQRTNTSPESPWSPSSPPEQHINGPVYEPGINNLKSFKLAPPSDASTGTNDLADNDGGSNTDGNDSNNRIESTPTPEPFSPQEQPPTARTMGPGNFKSRLSFPNLDSFRNPRRTSISSLASVEGERSVVSPPASPDNPEEASHLPAPIPFSKLRRSSIGVPQPEESHQGKLSRNVKSHEGTLEVPQSLREKYNQALLPGNSDQKFRRGSTGNESVFSDSSLNDTITSLSIASATDSSPASPLKRLRHQVKSDAETRTTSKRRNSETRKQYTFHGSSPTPNSPNYWLSQQASIALQENARLNKINSRLITKLNAAYEELLRVQALPKELERLKAEKIAQHEQLLQELQALEAQNNQMNTRNTDTQP